jgi:hypothetical protein
MLKKHKLWEAMGRVYGEYLFLIRVAAPASLHVGLHVSEAAAMPVPTYHHQKV